MNLLTGTDRSSRRPRRPAPGAVLHAVPAGDRTRSALCGASVVVSDDAEPWASSERACTDCAAIEQLPQLVPSA